MACAEKIIKKKEKKGEGERRACAQNKVSRRKMWKWTRRGILAREYHRADDQSHANPHFRSFPAASHFPCVNIHVLGTAYSTCRSVRLFYFSFPKASGRTEHRKPIINYCIVDHLRSTLLKSWEDQFNVIKCRERFFSRLSTTVSTSRSQELKSGLRWELISFSCC